MKHFILCLSLLAAAAAATAKPAPTDFKHATAVIVTGNTEIRRGGPGDPQGSPMASGNDSERGGPTMSISGRCRGCSS